MAAASRAVGAEQRSRQRGGVTPPSPRQRGGVTPPSPLQRGGVTPPSHSPSTSPLSSLRRRGGSYNYSDSSSGGGESSTVDSHTLAATRGSISEDSISSLSKV